MFHGEEVEVIGLMIMYEVPAISIDGFNRGADNYQSSKNATPPIPEK